MSGGAHPRVTALDEELRTWGHGMRGLLEKMIRDIDEDRLWDRTMSQDYEMIRAEMRRHEVLVTDRRQYGTLRQRGIR